MAERGLWSWTGPGEFFRDGMAWCRKAMATPSNLERLRNRLQKNTGNAEFGSERERHAKMKSNRDQKTANKLGDVFDFLICLHVF